MRNGATGSALSVAAKVAVTAGLWAVWTPVMLGPVTQRLRDCAAIPNACATADVVSVFAEIFGWLVVGGWIYAVTRMAWNHADLQLRDHFVQSFLITLPGAALLSVSMFTGA